MSNHCITGTGSWHWTKEEMMVYIDWAKQKMSVLKLKWPGKLGWSIS